VILRESYEGRWQHLPVIQKVGVIVALGSWCLFIAVLVWDGGKVQHLNTILVFATVTRFSAHSSYCSEDTYGNSMA